MIDFAFIQWDVHHCRTVDKLKTFESYHTKIMLVVSTFDDQVTNCLIIFNINQMRCFVLRPAYQPMVAYLPWGDDSDGYFCHRHNEQHCPRSENPNLLCCWSAPQWGLPLLDHWLVHWQSPSPSVCVLAHLPLSICWPVSLRLQPNSLCPSAGLSPTVHLLAHLPLSAAGLSPTVHLLARLPLSAGPSLSVHLLAHLLLSAGPSPSVHLLACLPLSACPSPSVHLLVCLLAHLPLSAGPSPGHLPLFICFPSAWLSSL